MLYCAICGGEVSLPDSEALFLANEKGSVQTDRVCRSCAGLLENFTDAVRTGAPEAIEQAAGALNRRAAPSLREKIAAWTEKYTKRKQTVLRDKTNIRTQMDRQ